MKILKPTKDGDQTLCMQTPWERALEFHGHVCPGLVIGFRAAEHGLRELGISDLSSDNLVVIAENQSCAVDAIQVVTGCTLGKGSLELRDHGKHVYSFVRRDTGESVRVSLRFTALGFAAGLQELIADFLRESSAENERILTRRREAIADQLLEMSEAELWEVSRSHYQALVRPRVLPSLCCARCGEGVTESRARLAKGAVVCIPCLQALSDEPNER